MTPIITTVRASLIALLIIIATTIALFIVITPSVAKADVACNEDEACWDWATMGNLTRCDLFTDDSALYVCQRQGEGGLSGWTVWTEQR